MSKQLSRIEKYGRRRTSKDHREGKRAQLDSAAESEPSEEERVSRRELHPSQRGKLTKLFYHSLIVLFILLLIGLLYWGRKMMP